MAGDEEVSEVKVGTSEAMDRLRVMEEGHSLVRTTVSGRLIGLAKVTKRARVVEWTDADRSQAEAVVREYLHGSNNGGIGGAISR